MADLGPGAVVGWLRAHDTADDLAGCAFLIGPDIVLTCAHVIGAHLGLPKTVPKEPPTDPITIRFEALQDELIGHDGSAMPVPRLANCPTSRCFVSPNRPKGSHRCRRSPS